jgi:hypothetical protein
MRRKSSLTIVEQAIALVPEFEHAVRRIESQVTLRGQSKSTLNNYIRRIALFVIRFRHLPKHVVKYLGQYTHRVAITNLRILNIVVGKVTFIAKDYRHGAVRKPVTLSGTDFLRRFTLHILPKRFVKIRRYGIYNHTTQKKTGVGLCPRKETRH